MVEKQTLIMQKAVQLFAAKGYHATSVQEIAEKCQMAKGSFYNYFKSKEELLISCIRYGLEYYEQGLQEIEQDSHLDSREKFLQKINFQIDLVTSNSDFVKMIFREEIRMKEFDELLRRAYLKYMEWITQRLSEIYPELPEELLPDCAIIFDSLCKGYMIIIMEKENTLEKERVSAFILEQMDSIVEGMNKKEIEPLLHGIPKCFFRLKQTTDTPQDLLQLVDHMLIEEQMKQEESDKKLIEALSALRDELRKENPNQVLLESLSLLLKEIMQYHPKGKSLLNKLKGYLQIEPN